MVNMMWVLQRYGQQAKVWKKYENKKEARVAEQRREMKELDIDTKADLE